MTGDEAGRHVLIGYLCGLYVGLLTAFVVAAI